MAPPKPARQTSAPLLLTRACNVEGCVHHQHTTSRKARSLSSTKSFKGRETLHATLEAALPMLTLKKPRKVRGGSTKEFRVISAAAPLYGVLEAKKRSLSDSTPSDTF